MSDNLLYNYINKKVVAQVVRFMERIDGIGSLNYSQFIFSKYVKYIIDNTLINTTSVVHVWLIKDKILEVHQ